MFKKPLLFPLLAGTLQVFGFLPPVDSADGVKLEIACAGTNTASFGYTVTVSTVQPVAGTFRTYLNDDWAVEGKAVFPLELPANVSTSFTFRAIMTDRTLRGLYPIHAEFGGAHPVAVFAAEPKTKSSKQATIRAERGLTRLTDGVSNSGKNGALFEEQQDRFIIHPAWRNGDKSPARMEFRVQLPKAEKIAALWTAEAPSNPHSDGVTFGLSVGDQVLLSRHLASGQAEELNADLSAFAGQNVIVSLFVNAVPKGNTTFDLCAIRRPRIEADMPSPTALAEGHSVAGFTPGPSGLLDGTFDFDGLKLHGFTVEVDGLPVHPIRIKQHGGTFIHYILNRGQEIPLEARIVRDGAATRVYWSMPGVIRDRRGEPRYTRLAPGPADSPLLRCYAGFGNVIEEPESFVLGGGGFTLSTRHVGADYSNGVSLLQHCDIFPDRLVYAKSENRFALETAHDAVFTFVPSRKGAFAAARAFKGISGYSAGKGVAALAGRTGLDEWGGANDQALAAEKFKQVEAYGMTNCVYIRHVWQRYGYDYRLPDIYPPSCGTGTFAALGTASRKAGVPFIPHDNYIDLYPDAQGFSYDNTCFTAQGEPVKAWFNKGRGAQSYRWLPHAFAPYLERNARLMKEGFAPDGIFIDVFTAIPPIDYYDRTGQFHPRMETVRHWRGAFDRMREILRPDGFTVSEAGTDALIGSLDAGQSDHFSISRWNIRGKDSERVPWHDMVTHGRMVLFAGGLDNRYGAEDWDDVHRQIPDQRRYGGDDYLCNTVIGGRNPMCGGPFNQNAVITYWLLNDVCSALAKAELVSHEFCGNIHRQHTIFSDGSEVYSNRGSNDWSVAGYILPQYGFYVKTVSAEAGIVRLEGKRAHFARTTNSFFGMVRTARETIRPEPGFCSITNGLFSLGVRFTVHQPVTGYRPFVHLCGSEEDGENIIGQGTISVSPEGLTRPGTFETVLKQKLPTQDGVFALRFGFYDPKTGHRLMLDGPRDGGNRFRAGRIRIARGIASYETETNDDDSTVFQNPVGTRIDFGSFATDGGVRLLKDVSGTWTLQPLPDGPAVNVWFKLKTGTERQIKLPPNSPPVPCDPPSFEPR